MSLLDNLDGKIQNDEKLSTKEDLSRKSKLEYLAEKYQEFIGSYNKLHPGPFAHIAKMWDICIKINFEKKINPEDIFGFMRENKNTIDQKQRSATGLFINSLCQNSYNAGFNDFKTYPSSNNFDKVFCYLNGTKEKPINLKILGDAGLDWCIQSNYINAEFFGNVTRNCGADSKNSKFVFHQPSDNYSNCFQIKHSHVTYKEIVTKTACNYAESSIIIFEDDIKGECVNETRSCNVYIYGKVLKSCGKGSKYTDFYSPHIENLKKINMLTNDSCRYFLLDKKNKPKEVSF